MPRIGGWNGGRRSNDFRMIDRVISEFFSTGTAAYLHLYMGPYQQAYPLHDATQGDIAPDPTIAPPQTGVTAASPSVTSIQDVLFMENRDRQYNSTVYEMRTIYQVSDSDFDMKQFGLFLGGDTIFLEFHYNDMISLLGRRIMPGDVIELPHQRDFDPLNQGVAINKFYVVQEGSKASDGYSATWWAHIWRVKLTPMTGATEYADILSQQAQDPLGFDQGTIGSLMSTIGAEQGISDAVVQAAIANVPKRNFETRQFWIVPGDETGINRPNVWTGDGVPPNGAALLGTGTSFPDDAQSGAYYLRNDYEPHALFLKDGPEWKLQEFDWRGIQWSAAHRLLDGFINNNNSAVINGVLTQERQNLSKALKPSADF